MLYLCCIFGLLQDQKLKIEKFKISMATLISRKISDLNMARLELMKRALDLNSKKVAIVTLMSFSLRIAVESGVLLENLVIFLSGLSLISDDLLSS